MTDQSPTAAFAASSFLDGANADYVDQLAARHAADPASVDPQWAAFFQSLGDSEVDTKRAASGPSWARADRRMGRTAARQGRQGRRPEDRRQGRRGRGPAL